MVGVEPALIALQAIADDDALLEHCGIVAREIPLFGFYLQPAVGGRVLSFRFWRQFVEIQNVAAIKIAAFNRYQTLDVVRAVAEARLAGQVALYTGNDDSIVTDLLTEYAIRIESGVLRLRIVGGLLGHWACWTQPAVRLLAQCHATWSAGAVPAELLTRAAEVTDCNSAIFDAANDFAGCIPGIHEILRRQGLMSSTLCLNPRAGLSPRQVEELDRVCCAYPHLMDDEFVAAHLNEWLG